jgi:hypothetical protein
MLNICVRVKFLKINIIFYRIFKTSLKILKKKKKNKIGFREDNQKKIKGFKKKVIKKNR